MSVMRVRGPNHVGRPVQTEQTLLRYTSAIAEQKKCWELLLKILTSFKFWATTPQYQHSTTCNRVCQRTQHVKSNNDTMSGVVCQQCCVCLDRAAAILHTANKF